MARILWQVLPACALIERVRPSAAETPLDTVLLFVACCSLPGRRELRSCGKRGPYPVYHSLSSYDDDEHLPPK